MTLAAAEKLACAATAGSSWPAAGGAPNRLAAGEAQKY